MGDAMLQLNQIRKRFGDNQVLCGIDLSVKRGEFITLLGSSGCGKTSLLRIIAGLEFSAARGNHSRFDSSKFKLVGDPKSGIVMVGDAKDAGRQVQADHAFRRPGLLNSRLGRRSASEPREREQAGAAQGGALARLRSSTLAQPRDCIIA